MKNSIVSSDFWGCGWIILLLIMLLIISLYFNFRSIFSKMLDSTVFRTVCLIFGIIAAYLVTDKEFIERYIHEENPFVVNAILNLLHDVSVKGGKELDDFYIASVTLSVALIAAGYAAESLYRRKVESGLKKFEENKDLFNKSLTFSFIVSLALILESMIGLYFSLNEQPLFTASVFGIMFSSVIVTARVVMMSMSLKLRNLF